MSSHAITTTVHWSRYQRGLRHNSRQAVFPTRADRYQTISSKHHLSVEVRRGTLPCCQPASLEGYPYHGHQKWMLRRRCALFDSWREVIQMGSRLNASIRQAHRVMWCVHCAVTATVDRGTPPLSSAFSLPPPLNSRPVCAL